MAAAPFTCFSSFFICFFLLSSLPLHSACPPFIFCGKLNISFPFSTIDTPEDCGPFHINCTDERNPTVHFDDPSKVYVIKDIQYERKELQIQDMEFFSSNDVCDSLRKFRIPVSSHAPLQLKTTNFSLVSCNGPEPNANFKNPIEESLKCSLCPDCCKSSSLYYCPTSRPNRLPDNCVVIDYVPLLPQEPFDPHDLNLEKLQHWLEEGFVLQWNQSQLEEHLHPWYPKRNKGNVGRNIGIGLSLGAAVFSVAFLLYFFYCPSKAFLHERSKTARDVEVFLRNNGSLGPKRYQYSDLKKMISSFKDKLGEGGYGRVYKGALHDGRLVAVKMLNNSKFNGEEFINEVASIGRTHHVNVVALLGFCSEGSKRALVYEFMPNGSLEKFIYAGKSRENNPLGWEQLYEIAVGIARGLEYLHRGCSTRIVHLDIKPHNILLDENFCPKISDFGLAKIFPTKESIISMTGTRGTIGYIAPEIYCRNVGGVSSKSDVYSYGMMVLEMVGGRRNIEVAVENTSEIYFPHWIYHRVELNGRLELHGLMTSMEEEIARKMILVGLWCIQTDPTSRPSTSRVVEMLEGSTQSIPIPPKPYLSSPSRTCRSTSFESIA